MASNLRPSVINSINKALDNSIPQVNSLDFTIIHEKGVLKITYLFNTNFFIHFKFSDKETEYTVKEESTTTSYSMKTTSKEVKKSDHLLRGTMAPGTLTNEERFEFYGTYLITHKIHKWISNLWEDLSANPLMREFNNHKKDLDDYLKSFKFEKISNGDQYFTPKETDDLKERLVKVEEQLADVLKQALTDKTKLKAELKELKEEFNTLKLTIPNLTKANWAKSMISKIYTWSSKKENQKLIAATAKYGQAFIEATIN